MRTTLQRLQRATARADYRTLCREILAPRVVAKLRSAGLPCEVTLSQSLGRVREPRVVVRRVKVDGDRALAQVHTSARGQRPSDDVVRLVKERGRWRVVSLAEPEPPAPRKRGP